MELVKTKSAMSRHRILDGARDLILSRGFAAMSIDSVCKSAGITKGGFFHYFASKEELGLAVINKFWADTEERESKAPFSVMEDPVQRLIGYLDYAIDAYQAPQLQKGCMLAIFTIELEESNTELFKVASNHFANWRSGLVRMFEDAANHATLKVNTKAWADLFISTLEGSLILAKSSNDPETIKRALGLFKSLFIHSLKS